MKLKFMKSWHKKYETIQYNYKHGGCMSDNIKDYYWKVSHGCGMLGLHSVELANFFSD